MSRFLGVILVSIISCTSSAPPIERPSIGGEALGTETYPDSLILPGMITGESWRKVALKIYANPTRPRVEFTDYMLEHPKHPIVRNDVWTLTLRHIGYGPLMSSHRGDDWVNNKVLELRSNDIVPIGTEFYRVTFDVNDDFITVERITEKLADRFKLSTNCECISTNHVNRYLMAEFKDDVKWSDRVRLDKFSATESSVVVSTSPEWEALYRVTRSGEWTAHTLNSGGEWAVRGFTYQVLSIVPPQDIPEGHVVGWIELRLKEQNPEHPAVN